MSHLANLPALTGTVVAILVVLGAVLAFIGSLGLLRLTTFYERLHAPTMGATLGAGLILIASMVLFSAIESRPVLHELVIAMFMTVTTPITFMLLLRAALHRERTHEAARDADSARPKG